MPWYRAGTVTVTNGSPVVTGAGTDFVANTKIGEVFLGPDGRVYEIGTVVSATELRIIPAYQGAGAGGQGYGIQPTSSFARDLADAAGVLIASFAAVRDGVGQGLFPDGVPAAPGFRFAADQDTGLRRPGSDTLALVTGGVDRLVTGSFGATVLGRVTAAQADTVGVAAPQLGALPPSSAFFGISQSYGLFVGTFGNTGDTWMQAQRVDGNAAAYNLNLQPAGGRVGVGTTAPSRQLDVQTSNDKDGLRIGLRQGATGLNGPALTLSSFTNAAALSDIAQVQGVCLDGSSAFGGGLIFSTASGGALSEKARLDAFGNLLVGVTLGASHTIARAVPQLRHHPEG